MKNKIALRLILYFAAALLIFALIAGTLFQTLFARHVINVQREELKKRAVAMADTLTNYVDSPLYRNMMGGGQGRYGMYLRMLNDIAMTDVWIVDEDLQLLTVRQMLSAQPAYSDLPEDAEALVKEVFDGKVPYSEGFSSMLGAKTLTVGAPIFRNGKVVGALLLHDAVSGMKEASNQGTLILVYSTGAALLVSIIPALLLSMAFAGPLNRMKKAALRLAGGDYDVQTGVGRKDEIGKLAQAIDNLSGKLRLAKKEREQQEQIRQDFLANVSHELKTPVAVLRGSLEALCDGVVTDEKQVQEYHGQMLGETKSLERLVTDLMDLTRLNSADFPMEDAVLSMNEVLSDALRSAGRMAAEKRITIHRSIPQEPVTYRGDYGRLKQMYLIILDNAVKFSKRDSKVYVSLMADQAVIRDEGPGIDIDLLPYIFDRFRKARTEENRQGSGLGLAIAKQIASRHNMQITVESELEKGTAFTVKW